MTKKEAGLLLALDLLVESMEKNLEQERGEVDYQKAETDMLMAYSVGHMKATEYWKDRLKHIAVQARRNFE